MKNNKNNIIRTSIGSFLHMTVLHIGAFVVTMVLTRILTTNEFGIISLVNTIVFLLIAVMSLGIPAALARYLAEHDNALYRRALIKNSMAAVFPWLVFCLLIFFIIFPYISEVVLEHPFLVDLQFIIIAILILEIIRLFIEKICHGTSQMHVLAKLSTLTSFLLILITIPVVILYQSAESVLIAKIIALFLPVLFILPRMKKIIGTDKLIAKVDVPSTKEIVKYALPLSVISLAGFGYLQTDILMMAHYSSTTDVAYYAVCVFVFFRLTVLTRAIGNGIAPSMADKSISDKDKELYLFNGLRFALIISVPVTVYAFINGEEVFALVFGEAYSKLGLIIQILSIYYLLSSILSVINPVMDFMGNASIRARAFIFGALVNILMNMHLIPLLNLQGAAIATLIAFACYFLIVLISSRKILMNCVLRNGCIGSFFVKVLPVMLVLLFVIDQQYKELSYMLNALVILFLYPVMLSFFKVFEFSEIKRLKR
ncbi:MAG: oligosaccharide flippase family protein [Methylococcaceae bacterium]|nr:oligosaccharide flippase family protein [Methylococcaceae bacterium]